MLRVHQQSLNICNFLASTTTALKQTLDSEIEYEKQSVDEDKEFPKAVTEYLNRSKLSVS